MHILVVDDHKALLHGFAGALREISFVKQVGQCSSYAELKQYLKKKLPDVIFLDLNLPPHNGLVICREITQTHKDICVAILTSYDDNFLVREAEKNGARAYFLKSVDIEVIENFLHDYHHGLVRDFVLAAPHKPEKPCPAFNDSFELISVLSKREIEVLKRIAKGDSHDEVTTGLNISYDTYKSHRLHIMQKLKLKNIAGLVQFAVRNKIVSGAPGHR